MKSDQSIQSKKLELIQWLSTIEDLTILKKIADLRKKEHLDWWNALAIEEKESIEKGWNDAENGKLKSYSEARKLYDKWL